MCVCVQLDQMSCNLTVILHNKSHLESTGMDGAILPSFSLLTLTKCRKPAVLYVNQNHSLLAVCFNVATLVTSNVTFYFTRGTVNYTVIQKHSSFMDKNSIMHLDQHAWTICSIFQRRVQISGVSKAKAYFMVCTVTTTRLLGCDIL
jgi:hypothetical protein